MNLESSSLILEGGGLRGVYTAGVLDLFMEKGIYFPYVIGVSMGACNAASYISKQRGRAKKVNIDFVNNRRYLSLLRFIFKGELFGMKFIFNTIPKIIVPFDFKTFKENKQKCIVTTTDCKTGEAVYFDKDKLGDDYLKILQASSSLPFISKPVKYKGQVLMDGGVSDSIPIQKSINDGNKKHIIVLTRPRTYRKKKSRSSLLGNIKYPFYKGLRNDMKNRYIDYNETIDFINDLEKIGKIFVIRPDEALNVGRVERNKEKLNKVYDQGYVDAKKKHEAMIEYLNN